MLCCCGGTGKTKSTKEIDMMLENDAVKDKLTLKVLLLGTGESGKSTVVKQLKLINKIPADESESELYAVNIHKNTVQCMQVFVEAANNFGYEFETEEEEAAAQKVTDFNFNDGETRMPLEVGEAISLLWQSKTIKKAYKRRSEFWFLDASQYYFDNVLRLCEEDYVPTEEDCIMTRVRTTGVIVTELHDQQSGVTFKVVDVGGQRNERKKWIHCFDDVNALLFVVNLAGYDQVMFEDPTQNRMQESLTLFEQITSNPAFENASIFLFFNKKDIFEQMIKKTPISKCFPEYEGADDFESSAEFIKKEYEKRVKRPVISHFIAARARKDVKWCWDEVKEELLKQNQDSIQQAKKKINDKQ